MNKEQQCPYHHEEHNKKDEEYLRSVISNPEFVCIFAKAALKQENITFLSVEHAMDSAEAAALVCESLYAYIQQVLYAIDFSQKKLPLASCVIAFPNQHFFSEEEACRTIPQLLLQMHEYDKKKGHNWADYVSNDPQSDLFSFSVGGEAFFMPLLYEHAHSQPRKTFTTTLVFNWHKLFEELRHRDLFSKGREVIRKRTHDLGYQVAELLADFGEDREFPQYVLPSLKNVELLWQTLRELGGEEPFGDSEGFSKNTS